MLDAAFLARLEALALSSRRRADSSLSGGHRAFRRGQSLEFADHREYSPGDDVRHVDWQLSARSDRLFVRLFESADDRTVRVLVDALASMEGPRWEAAQKAAAAIAFASLCGLDRVQMFRLGESFSAEGGAQRGRSQIHRFFRFLSGPTGGRGELTSLPSSLSAPTGAPVTVLVSDLLVENWESGLLSLRPRAGELHLIHVIDSNELRGLHLSGDLRLVDSEGRGELDVTIDRATRESFRAASSAWLSEIDSFGRKSGIGMLRIDAAGPVEETLLSWLRAASAGITR